MNGSSCGQNEQHHERTTSSYQLFHIHANCSFHTILQLRSSTGREVISFGIWEMRWLIKLDVLCRSCEIIVIDIRRVDFPFMCEGNHSIKVAALVLHVEVGMRSIVIFDPFDKLVQGFVRSLRVGKMNKRSGSVWLQNLGSERGIETKKGDSYTREVQSQYCFAQKGFRISRVQYIFRMSRDF